MDQSGEAVLQPILGELAGHADLERVAVSRNHRRVLEPHVVGPLGELEAQLLLDLRPDLVLVHFTHFLAPPCQSHDSRPDPRKARGNWPPAFANAVDNLGSMSPPISSCSPAREAVPELRASEHCFNRSRPLTGFVFSPPVEKSGPDFHRLAVPTHSKSPIRSVPKSGSAVVTLDWHQLDSYVSRVCVTCTDLARSTRSKLLPGRDCNKGLRGPQGPMPSDEVIRAVSGLEG